MASERTQLAQKPRRNERSPVYVTDLTGGLYKGTGLFWDLMTLQVTVLFASPFRVIKDIDIKCDTNWWEIIKYAIFAAARAARLAIKQYYHSEIHIDRYHSDTNFFGYRLYVGRYARSLNLDTIKQFYLFRVRRSPLRLPFMFLKKLDKYFKDHNCANNRFKRGYFMHLKSHKIIRV